MAIAVLNLVWRLAPEAVTPGERLVLLNLANYSRDDGSHIWPAVPTIVQETSLTDRGVRKVLKQLRQKGFLIAEGQMGGRRSVNRYRLNLKCLAHHTRPSRAELSSGHEAPRGEPSSPLNGSRAELSSPKGRTQFRPSPELSSAKGRTQFSRSVIDPLSDPLMNQEPHAHKARARFSPPKTTTEKTPDPPTRILDPRVAQIVADVVASQVPPALMVVEVRKRAEAQDLFCPLERVATAILEATRDGPPYNPGPTLTKRRAPHADPS